MRGPFNCSDCGRGFRSEGALSMHRSAMHRDNIQRRQPFPAEVVAHYRTDRPPNRRSRWGWTRLAIVIVALVSLGVLTANVGWPYLRPYLENAGWLTLE
jgi:hypothetical protein